jgi:hypothetical protein
VNDGSTATPVRARFYRVDVDRYGHVSVELAEQALANVEVDDGSLLGPAGRVSSRAVIVDINEAGELVGRPTAALGLRGGTLCFDPSQGGVRTRENRRARGAFNAIVSEANRFGMVNTLVHVTAAADRLNGLLRDVGGPILPPVHAVVGAHFGSRLPGYGCGDGDRRLGELRPMSGGHYRLSTRTTGVPEPVSVDPIGEIHLGPSRYRKPYAGWPSYLRNAAHNPAIIYHEFGHHLCRHTADFRLNAQRRPDHQRNGKTGVEEGVCDYFAAALLGSGRPYGWYRADRGRRRDPETSMVTADEETRDTPHAEGAKWARAWWQCRSELVARGLLNCGFEHDRALVRALLGVSEIGRHGKRRTLRQREAVRCSADAMHGAYISAMHELAGPAAASKAAAILDEHDLLTDDDQAEQRC